MQREEQPKELRRSIGLIALVLYGLGTIVGGGFYALIGKVSLEAGMQSPVAFLVACVIALLSAVSFAELSSRYPRSAGESFYVLQAFQRKWIAGVVGWLVILTGVVSAGTLTVAIGGFLQDLTSLPDIAGRVLCVLILSAVAAWGVAQSVALAATIAVIEVLGIVFIIGVGLWNFPSAEVLYEVFVPTYSFDIFLGIGAGAFLAFYSFIGFEDMVNMAEEVKEPERNLPLAIIIAVALSGVLYLVASVIAVVTVPVVELQNARTPLALVASKHIPQSGPIFGVVSVLAGVNGALVQIIMASRVMFGMSKEGMAPKVLARVNPHTRTPLFATFLTAIFVTGFALSFDLTLLAKGASALILIVFCMVNLSLVILRMRKTEAIGPRGAFQFPLVFPILGFITSIFFLLGNIL